MREPTLFILVTLNERSRHGYGIIQRVEEISDGRVSLGAGTLYGALDRLTEEGLIVPDREEIEQGRQRRYYRLTDEGVEALRSELARLEANARVTRRALGIGEGTS